MGQVSDLTVASLTAEVLRLEGDVEVWRTVAVEAFHALRAAKVREESLQGQLGAVREELRVARQQVGELGG
jgi:hypothetical protein